MRFEFLEEMIQEAEKLALKYFRAGDLAVDNKFVQGFDPVTIADHEIETLFRDKITTSFPDDAILGEEFEPIDGKSEYRWVIDPIDGTRAYIIGAPSFAILCAIQSDRGFEAAVISQPFTGERFWARDGAAFWQRGGDRKILKTSGQGDLRQALLASTFPEIGDRDERRRFEHLAGQVKLTRFGLDAYAYGLLAMGQIDLVVEAGLSPYDYSAPWAVVEAAGGVVLNWEGSTPQGVDRVIAAANEELAQKALEALKPKP